jgi:carboxypeptidase family protein/TonB-dependent receptor-like protein
MQNRKLFAILALALVFTAGQVFAQVAFNTGSIYGKTFDPNGGGLPGVTVTVEAEGMAPRTVTTGPGGGYRFAALQPGLYSLTFSLQGFTEVRQEDVRLNAGQNINLEVTLKQTTEEVVVVSGAEPVVDTKKTSTSSNYTQDYLKSVPSARDPWVILDQTPGIDVDRVNVGGSQSGQQSIYTARGGSFAQNGWSYDGVDITDPAASGATPTYYDFDSFQEIQITTGGQDPAIATGGVVINFITKRGGNTWSGQASGYFDNDQLQGDNIDQDLLDQHFAIPNAVNQVYEYGGDLGGPIVKDKAWVWGAFRKQNIDAFTAGVILHNQANPALNGTISGLAPQTIVLTDVNAKFNVAYNTANEGSFQYLYGNKEFGGRFALPPNQQNPNSLWNQTGPTKMYKASHSWIPNANLFLDAKFAYIDGGFLLDPINGRGVDNQPVFRLGGGNFFLEHGYVFYDTKRPQYDFSEDTNYFVQNKFGGDHEFKFGFAYKQASVTTSCQYSGDIVLYDFLAQPFDRTAGFGLAKLRELVNAKYDINSWGVYGGDTWRMNKLTLNLGVRFDHSDTKALAADAPANLIAPDLVPALSFPGQDGPKFDNISPRLGATYDIMGNGKTVVRGNYARFYDGVGPFPANFVNPLGERGDYTGVYVYYYDANGDGQVTRDELLDNLYGIYGTIGGFCVGNPACTLANNIANRVIDSNFNSEVTTEYMAGVEHQLGGNMSIGANIVHRKYDNLQDTYRPGLTAANFTCAPLTVTNPVTGESFTTPTFCDIPAVIDQFLLLNTNNRNRTYNGVELTFNKRMANNWMLRATAEFKDQKIHYEDDGLTFGGSFQDPTNINFTNDTWWAEQSTGSGSGGVYTGSRWGVKFSGAYQFPYDLTVGAYLKVTDGNVIPIIRRLSFQNYTNGAFNILLEPFDAERLETLKYMDIRIDKGFAMGSYGKLSVSADIFNAFNTNTALRIERRANTFQFREAQEIVSPRIVRLGLRYNF